MISTLNEKSKEKRYGTKRLAAFGLIIFMTGLLTVWGLNWTGPSAAENVTGDPNLKAASVPSMPSTFADLADRLSPTVVNVRVTKIMKATFHGPQIPEGPYGDFFEKFFGRMPRVPDHYKAQGAGSGVVISQDGYILTNNHVIANAEEVEVTLADQKTYKAKVIGRDTKTDLAVLKIETENHLPAAALGDSGRLKVGDWVLAIGNPFGLNHTVTSGIVSAKGRVIGAGPYDDFIQTDASINPGNSGGPLFNMEGKVVGINTAIIPQGQGIGFAIPVNTAKPLIPQLVKNGEVTRGYLGVSIQGISADIAEAMKLESREGALVADVVAGSPAEKAGIRRGDIIITYDGKTVKESHDLPAMVAATPVKTEVTVTVLRDGKKERLSITVGRLASGEGEREHKVTPAKGKWGLQLHDLTPQMARQMGIKMDNGVVVVGVTPGSPAERAGIRQGDLIVEVERKTVLSVGDVKESLAKSEDKDHLLLLVQRGSGKLYIPLKQQG
jgi:serine protease Do